MCGFLQKDSLDNLIVTVQTPYEIGGILSVTR
jgi:hypothetical protein